MSKFKAKRRQPISGKQRSARKEKKPRGLTMITGNAGPGFSYTVTPVTAEDAPHLAPYFKAHKYLPFWYQYDPTKRRYRQSVERALRALADADATTEDLTRAIVILGHSPDPQAVTALEELGERDHELAGMARMALQECLTMMGEDDSGRLPVAGVN